MHVGVCGNYGRREGDNGSRRKKASEVERLRAVDKAEKGEREATKGEKGMAAKGKGEGCKGRRGEGCERKEGRGQQQSVEKRGERERKRER